MNIRVISQLEISQGFHVEICCEDHLDTIEPHGEIVAEHWSDDKCLQCLNYDGPGDAYYEGFAEAQAARPVTLDQNMREYF